MLDHVIHAAAARATMERRAQQAERIGLPGYHYFHVALFGVPHPAAQPESGRLTVYKPAESHALHTALNQKMNHHATSVALARRVAQTCVLLLASMRQDAISFCGLLPSGASRTRYTGNTMVFVLDNYDSFTYNLVQYLGELGADVVVRRNDELTPAQVEALAPERILLSPGPCTPREAGILIPLIRHMAGKVPIFGVCLGHQAIGEAFGGEVVRANQLMHGKVSPVDHDAKGIFASLPTPLTCTRYHSLVVRESSLPAELEVSARTAEATGSVIMGLRHRTLKVEGVQFHPESVLTEHGHEMIRNFLAM